jgi:cobalt-zinc-cadmium efflux system outer membrane protein
MKPHYRRRSAALLIGFSLGCAPARAQDTAGVPAVVDLPAVLRLVREVSPRLSIERQGVAGAEANRITAGAYPNPTVNYGRYRPSGGGATLFDGSRQEQTTVELPLLIAGQRGARVEKAEREIEAARARVISGASSLAAEAGSAFIALLAAQEKAALLATAN